ncbi:hypothetical protein [Changchengzhania lutea]|uniref:hypothetical protein n=1 Tax=Changchengzhania lutea TaxID=2049305 RepID=UPI00115E53F2|nr:hypothetical protein [Changchengzhania lutea]
MKTDHSYKTFNGNKTIEELQQNIWHYIKTLKNFQLELDFYKFLVDKPIFKQHVMNLYEILARYKKEINTLNEKRNNLIDDLSSHSNQIRTKIECEDLACDNFFIKKHDNLELRVINFYNELQVFKFEFLQYIQGVVAP